MSKISEKTLRKWRREALINLDALSISKENGAELDWRILAELLEAANKQILNLTQTILDQYLLENKEKKQ